MRAFVKTDGRKDTHEPERRFQNTVLAGVTLTH